MKQKHNFYSWLVAALMIFAVISLGGCGGSSNHRISNAPDTSTDTEFPDIVPDVFDSQEFKQVFDDLEAEFAAEGISLDEVAGHVHTIFIVSGEVVAIDDDFDSASQAKYSVSSLSPKGREQVAARLKQPYESGDVIALIFPTADAINDLYMALGEQPMYVDPDELTSSEPDDLYPEVYAIAKRYNGESAHYFSYIIPDSKAILKNALEKAFSEALSSGDTSVSNDNDINSEYDNLRGEYVFQARRYAAFYRRAAHIDDEMEEQKEFVSSQLKAKAAAVGLINLFNYLSQRISVNFDHYISEMDWDYWGKHPLSYSAGVSDAIYSFHNFGDKNDYYFVMSDSFVKPDFEKKTVGNNIYTVGSMRQFSYSHKLTNVKYSVLNNAPANVNRSTSRTDGTNYSTSSTIGVKIGAKIGANMTQGAYGEFSTELSAESANGAGWNHSATWSTSEWSLTNQCTNTETKWLVDFKDPDNGYHPDWFTGDVPKASKERVDYASEWMWQVTEPNPDIAMEIALYREIRDTKLHKDKSKDTFSSYWLATKYRGPIKLNQPPHVICTAGNSHVLDKNGGNNLVFKFLCSGNWTITSNQSWCYVAEESKSGQGTGVNERSMFFYVDPYDTGSDTKAHNRRATITITDSETGQIQTIDVLQSNR